MDAKQTPLIELLERVPHNERCRVDEPDGMGSVFIPVGRLCHEAAAALRERLEQPEQAVETPTDRQRLDSLQKAAGARKVEMLLNRQAIDAAMQGGEQK